MLRSEVLAMVPAGVQVRWHRSRELQILQMRRKRWALQPPRVAREHIRNAGRVLLSVGIQELHIIFR